MSELKLMSAYEGRAFKTPHRVAMAPMTRNRAGDSRVPNAMMGAYYAQRATAGLMVSEAVDITAEAVGYPGTPGIYTEEQRQGWAAVVSALREAQPTPAPFFCQLFHTGRVSHVSLRGGDAPVAPSAIAADVDLYTPEGLQKASAPRALETSEIPRLIEDFVRAARAAVEAGFDGVELNAGNGYLLDQFLRDGTNQRTDAYGGAAAGRARLLVEVTEAIAGALGADKVAVRVSPINTTNGVSDSDPQSLFTTVADALNGLKPAYLHIIEAADRASLTPVMRERFDGTTIVNDGYTAERAERALQEGLADLVSFGQLFLANPDLPHRLATGAPLNEADPATFYGGTEEGYISYPSLND